MPSVATPRFSLSHRPARVASDTPSDISGPETRARAPLTAASLGTASLTVIFRLALSRTCDTGRSSVPQNRRKKKSDNFFFS